MAIDFRLTSYQRELRLESRVFAADVLVNARAAEFAYSGRAVSCDQARLRGHGGGGIFAEVPSSLRWRRERWSDRYRDHGRGTLRGER